MTLCANNYIQVVHLRGGKRAACTCTPKYRQHCCRCKSDSSPFINACLHAWGKEIWNCTLHGEMRLLWGLVRPVEPRQSSNWNVATGQRRTGQLFKRVQHQRALVIVALDWR